MAQYETCRVQVGSHLRSILGSFPDPELAMKADKMDPFKCDRSSYQLTANAAASNQLWIAGKSNYCALGRKAQPWPRQIIIIAIVFSLPRVEFSLGFDYSSATNGFSRYCCNRPEQWKGRDSLLWRYPPCNVCRSGRQVDCTMRWRARETRNWLPPKGLIWWRAFVNKVEVAPFCCRHERQAISFILPMVFRERRVGPHKEHFSQLWHWRGDKPWKKVVRMARAPLPMPQVDTQMSWLWDLCRCQPALTRWNRLDNSFDLQHLDRRNCFVVGPFFLTEGFWVG